jgi:hypothetical protein
MYATSVELIMKESEALTADIVNVGTASNVPMSKINSNLIYDQF